MGGGCKCLVSLVLALVLMRSLAEAQSGTSTTCAQELIPCVNFLNGTTTPPSSCCDPLKQTVENQLDCLCNIFFSPGLLQSFNVSVDQALALSRRCGVTNGITSCSNGQDLMHLYQIINWIIKRLILKCHYFSLITLMMTLPPHAKELSINFFFFFLLTLPWMRFGYNHISVNYWIIEEESCKHNSLILLI